MDAPPRWSVEPFDEDADPLDPGEGDSARGQFSGQWRGVVRPLLEWTCQGP